MQNEKYFYDHCKKLEYNTHTFLKQKYIQLYEYLYFGIHTRIRVDILCILNIITHICVRV